MAVKTNTRQRWKIIYESIGRHAADEEARSTWTSLFILKGLKIERKCDQASACLGKLGKEVGSDSDARCDTRTDKWDQGHIRLFG